VNDCLRQTATASASTLGPELQLACSLDFQTQLAQAFSGIPSKGPAVQLLLSYMLNIYSKSFGGRMANLLNEIRQQYSRASGVEFACVGESVLVQEQLTPLGELYDRRKQAISAQHAGRIEQYFTNFCQNFVLREPFFDYRDLRQYIQELVLRVASLRFLLFSHPAVHAYSTSGDSAPSVADRDTLDTSAIETFQSFAREIEHSTKFTSKLRELLSDVRADALGDVVCLTRF
jgi:hypothetical protein